MSRRRQIYEGKAKILYEGPEPGTLIQYFKDDATAFNAQKRGTISGKGVLNNRISEYLFTLLGQVGVPTHFIRRLNMREQLIRQVEIIPIEVVVRNVAAGTLSKRLGIEEGTPLPRAIIEYYYKDDALGDPMIADEHIACFGWASQEEMNDIADMAVRVNDFLCGLFAAIQIRLIDFKLEFGRLWENDYARVILADEISPDVREEAPGIGNLLEDFNFSQPPRAPLLLPVHPEVGPASEPVPTSSAAKSASAADRLQLTAS
ncbi:MAG TPA: phosphoribosylaminoimidazolesuccinocarboxamide synthase, partial [Allosphingosinicella sp.]|nr:phosphoribosylaminoimidazolesuccinocarboxamide synthase [Allosphingosinicella sp.]